MIEGIEFQVEDDDLPRDVSFAMKRSQIDNPISSSSLGIRSFQ